MIQDIFLMIIYVNFIGPMAKIVTETTLLENIDSMIFIGRYCLN